MLEGKCLLGMYLIYQDTLSFACKDENCSPPDEKYLPLLNYFF